MPIIRAIFTAVVVAMAVSIGRALISVFGGSRRAAGHEARKRTPGARADERAARARVEDPSPEDETGPGVRREDIIDVPFEEVS